ncbi:hypothetical protein C8R47DRAFT_1297356 [Mycena vitilis]|nr:hypothetical protein C8R47DRAFT_1297356 [Mycena vitilis]
MCLSSQPPELLDAIASFIPLPCDSLSLALASKLLHGIIVPHHIEFREVCCDLRRKTLWRALAEQPVLSGRIISLGLFNEVIPHHGRTQLLIPQSLGVGDEEPGGSDFQDVLSAAVSDMVALERFSLVQTIVVQGKDPIEPVLPALQQFCPNLRELEVIFCELDSPFENFSAPLWDLGNLTSVSIAVIRPARMSSFVPQHYWGKLFEMLSRCPNLQDLRIAKRQRAPLLDVSSLFAGKEWPRLRRLVIKGDFKFKYPSTMVAFLTHHSKLETLWLTSKLDLPHLPDLRWLFIHNFPPIVPENLPRLEYAFTTYVGGPHWDNEALMRTLRALPHLRGVTIGLQTTAQVEGLARELPQLVHLVFARSPWNDYRGMPWNKYGPGPVVEVCLPSAECIVALTSLTHLTHLETSVAFPSAAHADPMLDELLRSLSGAPKLQYVGVDFFVNGQKSDFPVVRWFLIIRDADGNYAGRSEVRNLRKPSAECIVALTSLTHLTHLETSVAFPSAAHADPMLDELLRSLSGAPKLQYVGVDFFVNGQKSDFPVVRWFLIIRDADGNYAGRSEVRNLRKVQRHDWEDMFNQLGGCLQ